MRNFSLIGDIVWELRLIEVSSYFWATLYMMIDSELQFKFEKMAVCNIKLAINYQLIFFGNFPVPTTETWILQATCRGDWRDFFPNVAIWRCDALTCDGTS